MADFLDTSFLVSYVRETPPESYKLLQIKDKIESCAFENGERFLQPGDANISIVDGVTNCYIVSKGPINIALSDGTTFLNMKHFAYGGENKISVSISNPSSQVVKVLYAAGLAVE